MSAPGSQAAAGEELARAMADSITVESKVPGSMIEAWIIAIAVTVLLSWLYLRQVSKTAVLSPAAYEKKDRYGWVVIVLMALIVLNIVRTLVYLFGESYAPSMVARVVYMALETFVLVLLVKKHKQAVLMYLASVMYAFCYNAAIGMGNWMWLLAVDVLFGLYLLFASHPAALFGFRKVRVEEPKAPQA